VALSKDRKAIDWRMVGSSLGLQFIFALLLHKTKVSSSSLARWPIRGAPGDSFLRSRCCPPSSSLRR
jgi:hypothetical protein